MSTATIGALRVILGINSAEFSAGLRKAQGDLQRVASSMQRTGAILSASITAPLVLFGRSAVTAAINAEELQSAFNYSFGAMAETMNTWARDTGDALGRSTQLMQQMGFTFNQLFIQAAPTRQAAADLSAQFALLALDLSSFFNVTESDALEKLRAGLIGEAEPLRTFGVFLNDALVTAKALEMGLGDLTGALTEQDKILARAAIIMEQTSAAQGDLARTADSAANQQRALQAEWQELSVTVGETLLPIVQELVGVLDEVVGWFRSLDPEVRDAIVYVGVFAVALGPVLIAIGSLIRAVGLFIGIVPKVVLGFRAISIAMGTMAGPIGIGAAIAAFAAVEIAIANTFQNGAQEANDGVAQIVADVNGLNAALATAAQAAATGGVVIAPLAQPQTPGFASFMEGLRTREEEEAASYEMRLAQLSVYLAEGQLSEEEAAAARARIEAEYNDAISTLRQENTDDQRRQLEARLEAEKITQEKITEALAQGEADRLALRRVAVDSIASIFGSLSQIIGRESDRALKISKAFAAAEVLVSTARGIAQAMGEGPGRFFKAAAIAASGAAQLAAIRAAAPGGGSIAPPSPGAGAGGGTGGADGGTPAPSQNVTIHLSGRPTYTEQEVRDLIEQLNLVQANGPKIKVY